MIAAMGLQTQRLRDGSVAIIVRQLAIWSRILDRIDQRLLQLLQRDGHLSAAQLGEAVGLSPSACHRRVAALEAAGTITGYAARIDPRRIGLGLDVVVDITLTSQSDEALNAFEAAVRAHDEILECQLLSGQADYRLRIAARDVADFDRLHRQCLARLPGVASMHSAFALRTIKAFNGYPVPATNL